MACVLRNLFRSKLLQRFFAPYWIVLSCALLLSSANAVEISDRSGRTINVEILEIGEDQIKVLLANGQTTLLNRARLSDTSDALISELKGLQSRQHLTVNELLGLELFLDENLWDDPVESIANRLQWPLESKTQTQSSYRYYPTHNYRVLSSRPYSAALYGENGKAQMISIVFANKGDYPFSGYPSPKEITAMEHAIDQDADRIKARLTQKLGAPDRQQFGSGRGLKQLIDRWNWNGHAFLLATEQGEYTSLKITPSTVADNKGKRHRLSDDALRKVTAENISRSENGDTLISNIPMVNQGPKGYCVPATFERYLRYLHIPADMYLLAMTGQTEAGGGTSLSKIIESLESYAGSQNRSLKRMEEEVTVRMVKKYIERGLPLIWTMYSSQEFNQFASSRSSHREAATEWSEWKMRTRSESRKIEFSKDRFAAHACMIIGYNKETDEIAVSDSWGPRYALRWVPATHAEQISQGYLYLIDY